jgi:DNA-binding CsgD family transcriptional regulator
MSPVSPAHAHYYAKFLKKCDPNGDLATRTVEQIVGAKKSSEAYASVLDSLIEAALACATADGLRVTMPSELRGVDLSGKDLRGIDLSFADLSGTNFNGADLRGANFRRTRLFETSFRGADLEETNFRNVISFRADFRGTSMMRMDAAGSCFAGANFSGAEMSGLRVGTPLQTSTDWNGSTINGDQRADLCGIAYNSYLMADVLRKPQPSSPHSEPLAASVEGKKLITWRMALVTVAIEYTELAEPLFNFMRSYHDKMVTDIFEIELTALAFLAAGSTIEEFNEELSRLRLPPVWQLFLRWQLDSQKGRHRGLVDLVDADTIEELGGCSDAIWCNHEYVSPLKRPGIVSRITAEERTMLGGVVEAAEPLSVSQLSDHLNHKGDYYFHRTPTISGPGSSASRNNKTVNEYDDSTCGHQFLTPREHTVLRLVDEGYSNKQICEELYISVDTVKSHLNRVFRKLGTRRRTQTLARARELRLL